MRRAALLSMTIVIALAAAMAQSPPADRDGSKIIALENAWNLAEAHKDVKALDQLLADTLVYVDYDGSYKDKAHFLASTRAEAYRPEQIVNQNVLVHLYDKVAVVTGVYRDKGTYQGKRYLRRGRFTDTWVYQNGVWKCVASQSTLMAR